MIDLKQLEKEIDTFLENETTDTLLKWLCEKRITDFQKRYGNGIYSSLKTCVLNFTNKVESLKLNPINNTLICSQPESEVQYKQAS